MKAWSHRRRRSPAPEPKRPDRTGPTEEAQEREALSNRAMAGLLETAGEPPAPPRAPGGTGSSDAPAPGGEDGGAPLPPELRHRLERVVGVDLSTVRVHQDGRAAALADVLGARAFTMGEHVWIGRRGSVRDVSLMGHEVAHVIQQRLGTGRGRAETPAHEGEARATGHAAAAGQAAAPIQAAAPTGPQRQEEEFGQTLLVEVVATQGGSEVLLAGESVAIVDGAAPSEVQAGATRTESTGSAAGSLLRIGILHPEGSQVHVNQGLLTAWSFSADIRVDTQTYGTPTTSLEERPLIMGEAPEEVPPPRPEQPAPRQTVRRRETPAGPVSEPEPSPAPPPVESAHRADIQRRIDEIEDELNTSTPTEERLAELSMEYQLLVEDLQAPVGPRDLTDDELESEIRSRREWLLDRNQSSVEDERVRREMEDMEAVVAERTPPPPPPRPDPQVQRVLRHMREGRWDTDSLAAELTEQQTSTLSLSDRVALLRAIAQGASVMNEDEQTILRLLRSTPRGDLRGLMNALDADDGALLQELESALDFDDYRDYHILLANLRLASREPGELAEEIGNAPVLTWSDPGLIQSIYTYRSYIEDAEITDDGKVRIRLWHNAAIMGIPEDLEFEPMELVQVYFPIGEEQFGAQPGDVLFLPAVNLLSVANKQFKGDLQLAADVASIAAGGAGLLRATTRAGRIIAAAEVAFGAADVVVRDYRTRIGQTPGGRRFLRAWSAVSTIVGIYGFARAALEAPAAFRALRGALDDFRGTPHGLGADEMAHLEREVDLLTDRVAEAERAAAQAPEGALTSGGGGDVPTVPPVREPPGPPSGGGGGGQGPTHRGATADAEGYEYHPPMADPEVQRVRRPPGRGPTTSDEPPAALRDPERPPPRRGWDDDELRREIEAEQRGQQEDWIPERDPEVGDVREQLHPRLSAQRRPSEHLTRALNEAGDPRPAPGYDAHHIIPTALYRSPYVRPELGEALLDLQQRLREAVAEAGGLRSGINAAENGVWLPRNQRVANETGSVLHIAHIHANNNGYIATLSARLRGLRGAEFLDELARIKREMRSGEFRF